jgi:hypothetical protein
MSGRFNVDVVLKSVFVRVGELSDDISNRLDPEIKMKVALNHFNFRITGTAPKLDIITVN